MRTHDARLDRSRWTVARWGLLSLLGAVVAAVWTIGAPDAAHAVPAGPGVLSLEQPDGTTFKARQFGDEWYSGLETRSGHTILRRHGWWVYAAKRADGTLRATDLRVTEDRPTMRKHMRDDRRAARADVRRDEIVDQIADNAHRRGPDPSVAVTGSDPVLVILVQFQDQTNLGTTAGQWATRYFGAGKSVVDFYKKNSYNQFTFTPAAESHGTANNGVVGWLTLPMTHPDSSSVERPVIREAIKAADPYVNYASFDTNGNGTVENGELHVNVVMAGLEESISGNEHGNSIWANRWFLEDADTPTVDGKKVGNSGFLTYGEKQRVETTAGNVDTHQATVGVIIHELGHDIGLPDLYEPDDQQPGLGVWSSMATGSWGRAPTEPVVMAGQTPSMFDAWSRWSVGWISPVQAVNGFSKRTMQAASNGTSTNTSVIIGDNPGGADWIGNPAATGSYYLVENRHTTGYDVGLPASGLVVLDIRENYPDNDNNWLASVEEYDGPHLTDGVNDGDEGDVWFSGRRFTQHTPRLAIGRISATTTSRTATFTVSPGPTPVNDNFAQAQALAGWSPATINTSTAFATLQDGEPEIGEDPPGSGNACDLGDTLWYRYTPPATGDLSVDLEGSEGYHTVIAYSGATLTGLTVLECEESDYDIGDAAIRDLRVTKGQPIYLQVGASVKSSYQRYWGEVTLQVRLRPQHDDRVNARLMPTRSLTDAIATVTATVEADEPQDTACRPVAKTVWYRYTPTRSGVLRVDTTGSSYDTIAAVWTGSRGTLASVGCSDNDRGSGTAAVLEVDVEHGVTYLVQVGGPDSVTGIGEGGTLTVSLRARPSNDAFSEARALTGAVGTDTSYTTNATKEASEPTHAGTAVGRSVWWTWTAERTGRVTFSTQGSTGDTVLAAYTGSTVGGLTQVAANDDVTTDVFWSRVAFDTVAGQTYRIAVDNFGTASSDVNLQFHELTDLAAAAIVRDVPGTTTFKYDVNVTRTGGPSSSPVIVDVTAPASVKLGAMPAGCTLDALGVRARCDLGVIAPEGRAAVEIPVDPRSEGPHTARVQLVSTDDYPADNSVAVTATPTFLCDNAFTTGNDNVTGTTGADILCGGAGDDRITGGTGNDKVFGGAGTDTAIYSAATARMRFDLGKQDGLAGFTTPYALFGPAGDGTDGASSIEGLIATSYADVIAGQNADGRFNGGDTITAGGGDDQINGLGGPDVIYGGTGNDTIDGLAGADRLYGDTGNDVIRGGDDADYLYGGAGADHLTGGAGGDNLDGGADSDTCLELRDTRIACEA